MISEYYTHCQSKIVEKKIFSFTNLYESEDLSLYYPGSSFFGRNEKY